MTEIRADSLTAVLADPRVRVVAFRDLERWDVGYFRATTWQWPPHLLRPLGSLLRRRVVEVAEGMRRDDVTLLEKITFGGQIQVAPAGAMSTFKGRLFRAEADQLIYSKIRIKQGSLAIVPKGLAPLAVSAEYPVYDIDSNEIAPDYLSLVLRSRTFLDVFTGLAHGGSTKTRIPPELFERQRIPVPEQSRQMAIVKRWREAVARRDETLARARDTERAADETVTRALGLPAVLGGPNATDPMPRALVRQWRQLTRWGVRFNQLSQIELALEDGPYPVYALRDLLLGARYGTNTKANSDGIGTPVLRINNVKRGRLDLTNLKRVRLSATEAQRYSLEPGDLLVIRTSGSRDLVGTCAVFQETSAFAFASYLIRLRLDLSQVAPEFVALFLNSGAGRAQIDAASRHIMQNNINLEELRQLRLPVPQLEVQHRIASDLEAARQEAILERAAAESSVAAILSEVESQIRGSAVGET